MKCSKFSLSSVPRNTVLRKQTVYEEKEFVGKSETWDWSKRPREWWGDMCKTMWTRITENWIRLTERSSTVHKL